MEGDAILFGLAVFVAFGFGVLVGGVIGWHEKAAIGQGESNVSDRHV